MPQGTTTDSECTFKYPRVIILEVIRMCCSKQQKNSSKCPVLALLATAGHTRLQKWLVTY